MTPSDILPPGNLNDDHGPPWKEGLEDLAGAIMDCPDSEAWIKTGTRLARACLGAITYCFADSILRWHGVEILRGSRCEVLGRR